jgi:hypothetical protein
MSIASTNTFDAIANCLVSRIKYKVPNTKGVIYQILAKKSEDNSADTSELEKEIDNLVYKLYQLTYDEVKIIDPEFTITEKEYEAIKIE